MNYDQQIYNEVRRLVEAGHDVHGWKGNTNWYRIDGRRYPKWAVESVLHKRHGGSFRKYVIKHSEATQHARLLGQSR